MKREQLEHIIRAAAAITNQYEIVIVGSQSILGTFPTAPAALLVSMEADVYPLDRPDLADLIDGAIGEESLFHERFGYYAQGVGPETAVLPAGWKERLCKIQNANTDLKTGYCLEPHDLAVSKLMAGRPKDWDYVQAMIDAQLVEPHLLLQRLGETAAVQQKIESVRAWIRSRSAPTARPVGERIRHQAGGSEEAS